MTSYTRIYLRRAITSKIHYIAGFITAFAPPYLAVLLFLAFTLYEVFEYLRLHDTLYLDYREYAVGLYIGSIIKIIV